MVRQGHPGGCGHGILRALTGGTRVWLLLLTLVVSGGLSNGSAVASERGPVVFAAASLKTALDEIADAYAAETGVRAVLTYAGSSVLARQIEQGAPADLFISANTDWMNRLAQADLIVDASRSDLLANALVVIAHGASEPIDLTSKPDLVAALGEGRLAMALVDAVPAGIYGKAGLEYFGLWDGVAPRIAQADNVRAALALVALGEAPLGITYATDALAEPRVSVVAQFPDDSHPPITYPVAVLDEGAQREAQEFLDYLKGRAAGAIFEANGFRVLSEE